MLNYLKQWYEENFTDPNQVSLALIVIFSVLITYILVQTISPILVAIVSIYAGGSCSKSHEDYSYC